MSRLPLLILCMPLLPLAAAADPLDLSDPTSRTIHVQFESSRGERPDILREVFSEKREARVEAAAQPEQLRVVVAGSVVEEILSDQDPKPGSFSDFVWVFDRATGHVLSARVSGVLNNPVKLGFMTMRVESTFEADMDTRRTAGYLKPKSMFGYSVSEFCDDPGDPDCTIVPTGALDPETGYVNAVGTFSAKAAMASTVTFASLGEAIFSEVGDATTEAASAAGAGGRDLAVE